MTCEAVDLLRAAETPTLTLMAAAFFVWLRDRRIRSLAHRLERAATEINGNCPLAKNLTARPDRETPPTP